MTVTAGLVTRKVGTTLWTWVRTLFQAIGGLERAIRRSDESSSGIRLAVLAN